jgi:hypothetical protein
MFLQLAKQTEFPGCKIHDCRQGFILFEAPIAENPAGPRTAFAVRGVFQWKKLILPAPFLKLQLYGKGWVKPQGNDTVLFQ